MPSPDTARQDMRLWIIHDSEDLIVCNNEKLASGGTSSYLHAADNMLRNVIFAEGSSWPDVITAPAFLSDNDEAPNFGVKVNAVRELCRSLCSSRPGPRLGQLVLPAGPK